MVHAAKLDDATLELANKKAVLVGKDCNVGNNFSTKSGVQQVKM